MNPLFHVGRRQVHTIYLNGNWAQVNNFNDAVRIIHENMGTEFSQEFDRALKRHINEQREVAIEEECSQCIHFSNE